jgi:hypothetical protein
VNSLTVSGWIAEGGGNPLRDLLGVAERNTSAGLMERTIAFGKLMRAAIANTGSDSRGWRLAPARLLTNQFDEMVNVLV